MSGRSCTTGSVRSCAGSVRLGAALAGGGGHEVVLDALYERKRDKKTVRVLTVIVYVFCVSLAAIMLSLYYVFFWEPKDSQHAPRQVSQTVRRPPATSPSPTCFTPHTGRSDSTVGSESSSDSTPPTSYAEEISESAPYPASEAAPAAAPTETASRDTTADGDFNYTNDTDT